MYVVIKYKLTKDDGEGNRTFSVVGILDYSNSFDKFKHLIKTTEDESIFKRMGNADVSILNRGCKNILIDLDIIETRYGIMHKIRRLIRERNLQKLIDK